MFKTFLKNLSDYFEFSRSERNASILIIVLILTCCIALLTPLSKKETVQNSQQAIKKNTIENKDTTRFKNKIVPSNSPHNFDPNKLDYNECITLGLSPKQSKNLISYIYAGGVFKKPEDLLKIYSMDSASYNRIAPYICLVSITKDTTIRIKKTQKTPSTIEINLADSSDLEKISGIGPILAKRILRYRTLLGGYYKKEQLLEVYGIKPELLEQILTKITIDSNIISPININTATYEQLASHPYIKSYKAKGILLLRNNSKTFSSPNELIKNKIISAEDFLNLKRYLSVY